MRNLKKQIVLELLPGKILNFRHVRKNIRQVSRVKSHTKISEEKLENGDKFVYL